MQILDHQQYARAGAARANQLLQGLARAHAQQFGGQVLQASRRPTQQVEQIGHVFVGRQAQNFEATPEFLVDIAVVFADLEGGTHQLDKGVQRRAFTADDAMSA